MNTMRHRRHAGAALPLLVPLLVACGTSAVEPGHTSGPPDSTGVADTAVAILVGAGDIASCGGSDDEATARLLDSIPGTVFTAGDNAYSNGSPSDYANCYAPSWGRHRARTRPAPGNHDYNTSGAAGYFGYFGAAAGDPARGWYSYDLGAWHVVALNSNLPIGTGSPQLQWLAADLAASGKRCTVAYWHHPRFSSGAEHGSSTALQPAWQVLYDAGAELVISGHDHDYERFAPQTPSGAADPARGIREFVAGTGGAGLYSFATPIANSEVRDASTHGVLELALADGAYHWAYRTTPDGAVADSGSGTCH